MPAYELDDDAVVEITFKRKVGRRSVSEGTLTVPSRYGKNRVAFSGRIGGRALKPGSYRATSIAYDDVGNGSRGEAVRFAVVAG